tara:strand:- start:844 stop:1152 length:309 start_codon:yes stop_codon:yes gene_type:complete
MKKLLFKIIAFLISLFTAAAIGTVMLGGTYLLKEINGWEYLPYTPFETGAPKEGRNWFYWIIAFISFGTYNLFYSMLTDWFLKYTEMKKENEDRKKKRPDLL